MRLRSNWSQFRLSSTLYIILLFEFAPVSEIHWLKKRKKGTHIRTELISIPTPTHPLDGAYYTPDGPIKGAQLSSFQALGIIHSQNTLQ